MTGDREYASGDGFERQVLGNHSGMGLALSRV